MELRASTARVTDGVADADTVTWARATASAFLAPQLDTDRLARGAAAWAGHRLRGVHEAGDPSPVATLRSWDARMTVPGGDVAVDAVTAIGVRPTHRRRGLARRVLTEDLAAAARAGTPLAALTSTQGSLYERFGFGLATWTRSITVDTARAHFRDPDPRGSLEVVAGPAALAALAGPVHARARRRHPGAMDRAASTWEGLHTGATAWSGMEPDRSRSTVLWRDEEGRPAGYLVHRVETGWHATGAATLTVLDLQTTTPTGYAELWRHLCSQDLVGTVRWDAASVDEPLPWLLTDHRAVAVDDVREMLWLRVLDVPAALAARTFPVADRLALRVTDDGSPDAGPTSTGRWLLDTTDALAPAVTRLDPGSEVDVVLPLPAVGSVLLGGVDPRVLLRTGRIAEDTPGAAGRLARLLAPPSVPWNGTRF